MLLGGTRYQYELTYTLLLIVPIYLLLLNDLLIGGEDLASVIQRVGLLVEALNTTNHSIR